jgi:VWFA-related protein
MRVVLGYGLRCTLAGALLATVASTSAQEQVFRSRVNTVPIYATVTDAGGALVTDLTAGDFEVEDNGQRQTLTIFKSDVQPMTIAILLDTSPSVFAVASRIQQVGVELVRRLLAADRAALGTFSHVVSLDPALTSDPAALVRRLAGDVPFPAGTAVWDALDEGTSVRATC